MVRMTWSSLVATSSAGTSAAGRVSWLVFRANGSRHSIGRTTSFSNGWNGLAPPSLGRRARASSPATVGRVTEDLRAGIRRGQRLDRDLARALGRRPRPPSAGAGVVLEGLDPTSAAGPDRALVAAAQAGDAAARAEVVQACLPLIAATARTYRTGQVQRLELVQEGVVGVLRALERFDAARGIPFWGYASWWVRQAMQQLVSELTRPVVLSDRALRHLARLKHAHQEAVRRTGREPGRGDLAERTGLSLEQVDDLLATDGPARRRAGHPERPGRDDRAGVGDRSRGAGDAERLT